MATDGLPGQKESTVVHERNCAIEATRRTMNPQRTATSVLTVCLTSGGSSGMTVLSYSRYDTYYAEYRLLPLDMVPQYSVVNGVPLPFGAEPHASRTRQPAKV
jgi:hypothetical protein